MANDGWRYVRGAENASEFLPDPQGHVYHGSCQELALLGAAHAIDPARWPLTGASLAGIVREMHENWYQGSDGKWYPYGDAGGTSAPNAARWWLTRHGYPLVEFPVRQLADVLSTYGGRYSLILEYAWGQNLPGDEPTLRYHFNCLVGFNEQTGEVAAIDGDNLIVRRSATGHGPLCAYSTHNIVDAKPVNICMVKAVPMLDMSNTAAAKYFQEQKDGSWLCPSTGFNLHGGILAHYRSQPYNDAGITLYGLPLGPETPIPGMKNGQVAQLCERAVIIWDKPREYDDPPGSEGECYTAHLDSGIGQKLAASLPKAKAS
jgi:hypothetical protein